MQYPHRIFMKSRYRFRKKNEIATLSYSGKASLDQILCSVPHNFLKIESSSNTRVETIPVNSFVLDDNIFVLNELIRINKKATLFYLDPPYGTGLDFQMSRVKTCL